MSQDRLAREFARVLSEWLTSGELIAVNARNRTYPPSCCASHDFCDANMAMLEAWLVACGREPDPENQSDADLWGAAWDIAKAAQFNPEAVTGE